MAACGKSRIAKIEKVKSMSIEIQNLLREAVEARLSSYSPYSNFPVGAAVLCDDGTIFRGCNIENASFPIGICAEKTAIGTAICSGKKNFKAIAVIANQETSFTTPCGGCRQFMSEFGQMDLYVAKPELKDVLVTTLRDILPLMFEVSEDFKF